MDCSLSPIYHTNVEWGQSAFFLLVSFTLQTLAQCRGSSMNFWREMLKMIYRDNTYIVINTVAPFLILYLCHIATSLGVSPLNILERKWSFIIRKTFFWTNSEVASRYEVAVSTLLRWCENSPVSKNKKLEFMQTQAAVSAHTFLYDEGWIHSHTHKDHKWMCSLVDEHTLMA